MEGQRMRRQIFYTCAVFATALGFSLVSEETKVGHSGIVCPDKCPATVQPLPYVAEDLVFKSLKEVKAACTQMGRQVQEGIDQFITLSQKQDYDRAYQIWSDLLFRCWSFRLEMGQTMQYAPEDSVKRGAETARLEWLKNLQQIFASSSKVRDMFIKNAQYAESLSPDQRWLTASVLRECKTSACGKALKQLSPYPATSFSVAKGLATPLDGTALSELKILTANILCFPGQLPYTYGGTSPWKDRIDALVDVFLQADADILCLQEVWDPEAMRALVDKLKEAYVDFVYNAGDPSGTMQVKNMGYNSGLFIASKLPLENIAFHRFPRSIPEGSNRGAFMATCLAGNQTITFATTHLQHGEDSEQIAIRKEQLLLCNTYLQEALSKQPIQGAWGVLMGDLNINGFSKEAETSGLTKLFAVPYLEDLSQADMASKATCSNYFSDLVATPVAQRDTVVKSYEILDYAVAPVTSSNKMPLTQTLIPLICMDCPEKSLSDHNALLTVWSTQKKGGL